MLEYYYYICYNCSRRFESQLKIDLYHSGNNLQLHPLMKHLGYNLEFYTIPMILWNYKTVVQAHLQTLENSQIVKRKIKSSWPSLYLNIFLHICNSSIYNNTLANVIVNQDAHERTENNIKVREYIWIYKNSQSPKNSQRIQ